MSDFCNVKSYLSGGRDGIHGQSNFLAQFYAEQIFLKIISMFRLDGLDAWQDEKRILSALFLDGWLAAADNLMPQNGASFPRDYVLFLPASSTDEPNFYYNPTRVVISTNAAYGEKIVDWAGIPGDGRTCAIIRIQPDYLGVVDILKTFSFQLAAIDSGIDVGITNSKMTAVFYAADERESRSIKKSYDDMASGKPMVVVRKNALELNKNRVPDFFNTQQKSNIEDLQLAKNRVWNELYTLIGYPNANTDKKERLLSSEVESNSAATRALRYMWLDEISEGLKRASAIFGKNYSIRFNEKIFQEVSADVSESAANADAE